MFDNYFVDLHIHIGSGSKGQPVKITASRKLNFANIAEEALDKKGLDMIGIIDCASPVVIEDIEKLLDSGEMRELPNGGIIYKDQLVILLGSEVESREENGGQAHYLAYFPTLEDIKLYSEIMDQYITNINLSSQSTGLTGKEILQVVESCSGMLIPAHGFTPHKSFYGNSFSHFTEVFTREEWSRIPALELGLSADTHLADYLNDLGNKTFLSNSDAHSLGKIAREYNIFQMENLNYKEFELALKRKKGRKVVKNYGLDPKLGKYHRSYCPDCEKKYNLDKPVLTCPVCHKDNIVTGVKDRVLKISKRNKSTSPSHRPPYIYQVPLLDLPGIGKKRLGDLLNKLGTEMDILHEIDYSELCRVVNKNIARSIIRARKGDLEIEAGGGGNYGKVVG
mgnify:CR=1 FL=1